MGRFTSTLAVLARHNCNSRKCSGAEPGIYSVLAFEATKTLCKEIRFFFLLVNFGRWIKRGFIKWFKETGIPHCGEGVRAYMRSHGCSRRTEKEMRKPLLPPTFCPITRLPVHELLCDWNESDLQKQAKCYFLFYTQPLGKCLGGLIHAGTKETLMAWGVPRQQWCHLGRHCGRNSPRGFLLSFPPAPDQRPQGKWILGGGGVSCCERMLVCFTAISQRLCSSSENRSSIINSLVSVERSRAAGSRELKEALQGKQKKAFKGK